MEQKSVTSTEFQNKAGQYLDEAGKTPVFITRYDRPVRVLIDIEEYHRLKALDTRLSFYPHELPGDIKTELDKGFQGRETPDLDHLMK